MKSVPGRSKIFEVALLRGVPVPRKLRRAGRALGRGDFGQQASRLSRKCS
jgi:hypothetical protein